MITCHSQFGKNTKNSHKNVKKSKKKTSPKKSVKSPQYTVFPKKQPDTLHIYYPSNLNGKQKYFARSHFFLYLRRVKGWGGEWKEGGGGEGGYTG